MTGTEDKPELRTELEARGYQLWNPEVGKIDFVWTEATGLEE